MEKKPTIIVVDDEPILLNLLKQSLDEHGFDCIACENAVCAIQALERSPADLLVTDITLPGMRGLELTREAKRLRPEMNVIIMTGYVDDFSYDQAIEAGAADFIKKPFTVQELLMRIKHVRLQEQLRAISITDELTGLLNRRGFFALAEQQMKIQARNQAEIGLLFADLDSLKAINDTWGHRQGDLALSALADIFKQTFRDSDIVARISGDEFAVLMMDMPETSIALIVERLEQSIASYNDQSGAPYRLSISVGVAVHDPERTRTIDDLLKEADDRMYESKLRKKDSADEAGRNRR